MVLRNNLKPLLSDKNDSVIDHQVTYNLQCRSSTLTAGPQTHQVLLSLASSSKVARSSVTLSRVRHACVIALKVTACSYCH